MTAGWAGAAAVLAAAAAAVAIGAPPRLARRLGRGRSRPGRPRGLVLVPLGGVALVATTGLHGHQVAQVVVLAAAVGGVGRLLRQSRADRAAAARRQRAVEACETVVGELRAGRPALHALEVGAETWPELVVAARAARLDGDVPAALREVGSRPGAEEVARVAAAWQLSAETGAGLAAGVTRVLDSARARQATDRLVQGELASARATARLVVALPVVVLLAADGLGADPWGFLVDTWPGTVCLAAGVGLALAGLEWIERIGRAAAGGAG